MAFQVTMPTGFIVEAQAFNNKTRQILRDRVLAGSGSTLLAIAKEASVTVASPGPYAGGADPQGGKLGEQVVGRAPNWEEVAFVDLATFLTRVRARVRGEHWFNHQCEYCQHTNEMSVDLSKIVHKPMSEEGIRHLTDGVPIQRTIAYEDPDTKDVVEVNLDIVIQRGKFSRRIAGQQRRDVKAVPDFVAANQILRARLHGGLELDTDDEILEWYLKQPWDFTELFTEQLNEILGGADSTVEGTCENCSAAIEGRWGFDFPFFYPQKPKSAGARRRAARSM